MASTYVAMMPTLRSLGERYATAGRFIDKAMWTAYRGAGSVYGDSADSRDRWLREVEQIAQLRQQARDLETQHAALRRIAEKRREQEDRGRDQ